jgi:multidrug efflux system outer membrane protein
MIRRGAWSVCLWLVCAGCALTPDYERPELDLPETYLQPAPPGESIANLTWWDLYGDPELRSLIETALEENQDLALALARVAEARYQVTFVRADQFPFLDVFGSGGRGRGSERQAGSQTHGGSPSLRTSDQFAIGGEISFEVDLWRKYSRATEGSRADLMATEAAHRNVTISLVASVSRPRTRCGSCWVGTRARSTGVSPWTSSASCPMCRRVFPRNSSSAVPTWSRPSSRWRRRRRASEWPKRCATPRSV